MSFWNNLFKKKENRDLAKSVDDSISLDTKSADAISLIFGNYAINNLAMNLSAVYRAVSIISNSFASLPICLYKSDKNGNKDLWISHPVYNLLLKKPNNIQTSYEWKKKMVEDILLRGNAYSQIIRDADNKVVEIRYIPAGKVSIKKLTNREGDVVDIQYSVSGKPRMLESDEMIHLVNETDSDGVQGISVLDYARRTINLANYGDKAAESYFKNGGKLSGLIKVNTSLTNKQKEDMKEAWREAFSGDNMNGIAVLTGAQSYESIQMNASDAQLLESRKFSIDEIARFFNVSPLLLYDLEHSNYSSQEQARLALLTDTLQPIMTKFENELENKLFLPYESSHADIRFSTEEFLRTDKKTQSEYYRTLWNFGVVSTNEVRAALDMNKIEDGDEHYIQAQMVTLKNAKYLASNPKKIDSTLMPKDNKDNTTTKQSEE